MMHRAIIRISPSRLENSSIIAENSGSMFVVVTMISAAVVVSSSAAVVVSSSPAFCGDCGQDSFPKLHVAGVAMDIFNAMRRQQDYPWIGRGASVLVEDAPIWW